MSDDQIRIAWEPPGPIAARFMLSMADVQLLNGPIGSGKTTACLIKAIQLAAKQKPSTTARAHNAAGTLVPVRKFKLAVVRDTYRQLWKTTLPSWFKRVPQTVGEFNGGQNGPASHRVQFQLPPSAEHRDGTMVDFIAEFAAIGENDAEDFMRGYEPTAWYLNEADLLSAEVFELAGGRAGRYPDMSEGGPSWYGILADCNAPELDSWVYEKFFMNPTGRIEIPMPEGDPIVYHAELFRQPGGRETGAENLKNLVRGYYQRQSVGKAAWYVARMIDNKPGHTRAGQPVHPEFNDALHVPAEPLEPIPGIGLVIGLDPRTVPSATFLQRLPNGQRRFISELQGEQTMGPRRFGKLLNDKLHSRFPMIKPTMIRGMVDPTAQHGVDKEAGDKNWLEIVSAVTGIRIDPAPSNAFPVRREALKKPLMELIDGQPAILVSPECVILRAALNSGFRYRKMHTPGSDKWSAEPEKNHFADLAESAEYACLADGADLEIIERKRDDTERLQTLMAGHQHDWDPLNRGGE